MSLGTNRIEKRPTTALGQLIGSARQAILKATDALEPDSLPRAAFNDGQRARGSGERQWSTFSPDRKRRETQRQYLLNGNGLELASDEPKDAIDRLSEMERKRRCAICVQCMQNQGDKFDETFCPTCAVEGILSLLPTLDDNWAITAARSLAQR